MCASSGASAGALAGCSWGLCMGAGLQGAGRPVWVINDSDRPDLTHSITLRLTHHQLIHHTDTWQPHPPPHPASPRHQPRTGAMPYGAPRQHFGLAVSHISALKLLLVSSYSWHRGRCYSKGLIILIGLKLSMSNLFFYVKCMVKLYLLKCTDLWNSIVIHQYLLKFVLKFVLKKKVPRKVSVRFRCF